jgi:hypothetical protein
VHITQNRVDDKNGEKNCIYKNSLLPQIKTAANPPRVLTSAKKVIESAVAAGGGAPAADVAVYLKFHIMCPRQHAHIHIIYIRV